MRRLVAGDEVWLWSVRHGHRAGPDGRCREVLSLHRTGLEEMRAVMRLVFAAGPGRYVAEGVWSSGSVSAGGGLLLNLHEPGVVRRLLESARGRGLVPERGEAVVDGWPLFDVVVAAASDAV
ncbi:hypothetical protein [Streptomyces alkaliterrae]|uniref:hypothetical protein n=1 Tax=Streptomyces alkaliterrae TaxID=2213162 RepID=UPI002B1EE347|nr:hypothetical protein [Streptomyces alkaliterrae]